MKTYPRFLLLYVGVVFIARGMMEKDGSPFLFLSGIYLGSVLLGEYVNFGSPRE